MAFILLGVLSGIAVFWAISNHYINPAPPSQLVISTGNGEGEYDEYANLYQDTFKEEGITLTIRKSSGAVENYNRLKDPKSDVDVGFVHDGLGSVEEAPDLASLGSMYYEPIWIFYRASMDHGNNGMTRFNHLLGKKISVGNEGGGTHILSLKILKASGINETNSKLLNLGWQEATDDLKAGKIDAAFFLATANDKIVRELIATPGIRLMSLDQAEAITRQMPSLHHLILPHGAMNLERNLPDHDVDMISATATLLVKDSVHPALIYLLLKAASQVHDDPGIFEKKNEFPIDKDDQFPLSAEAKNFYKSGTPFWQKLLPFWLATLIERFILIAIPLLAVALPVARMIPKFYQWRTRKKIHQRYGELKYLETLVSRENYSGKTEKHLHELDRIEERVKDMKLPIEYAEHLYSLRGHIDFVREKLQKKHEGS